MKNYYITIIIATLLVFGCKKNSNFNENDSNQVTNEYGYEDGTYCAEVDYYYSATGTNSTYTLEVEIENNELTVIHWPNGGWLDSSHFTPPDITNGEVSFTSDVGVDYNVRIIGSEGDCSIDSYAKDEDDLIRDKEEEEDQIRQQQDNDESARKEQDEQDEEERNARKTEDNE